MNKMLPMEDTWAFQQFGAPFPDNQVRAPAGNNYVALWYQHGRPLMGRAWAEIGKIQVHINEVAPGVIRLASDGTEVVCSVDFKTESLSFGYDGYKVRLVRTRCAQCANAVPKRPRRFGFHLIRFYCLCKSK